MSRIGKAPVEMPSGVKCEINGGDVKITGPKGTLESSFRSDMNINLDGETLTVERPSDKPEDRAYHGLTRALIQNMVVGVTEGASKHLASVGVGYRCNLQGKSLNLLLGYSHPVTFDPPEGITFEVEGQNNIKVSGIDKQLVGQTAAKIRALRKPEPYKGKGIKYSDERIRRKAGKTAK